MISWMGYGASNADICKVVASLSDFFRLSLNKGEDSFTLADELNHVKATSPFRNTACAIFSFDWRRPGSC